MKRLLVIGVGCQIQALRTVEKKLVITELFRVGLLGRGLMLNILNVAVAIIREERKKYVLLTIPMLIVLIIVAHILVSQIQQIQLELVGI